MTRYFTSHDLARIMRQSDDTARRVLREVWPDRDAPTDWALGQNEWNRVLRHIAHNTERRFGCRRKRVKYRVQQTTLWED